MNEISQNELQQFKTQYHTDYSIGDLTPTICELHGVPAPKDCGGTPIPSVVDQASRLMGGLGKNQRTLIFCPDAVGQIHYEKFPDLLKRVEKIAGFKILSSGVMPSVTPVCYATIFSGASPKVHGIQQYQKPVLSVETMFDVFPAAGKNVAIVSVNTCSIDMIFRNRDIDYYSTRCDEQSFRIARDLIVKDEYDVIVCYYTSYDEFSHQTGPYSKKSVDSLERSVSYFETLAEDVEKYWSKWNRTVVWVPDHGNHVIDEQSGGHGVNIPEDMLVNHFYRIRAGK